MLRTSFISSITILASTLYVSAQYNASCMRLNEIHMAPGSGIQSEQNREWIELYNTGCDTVDIADWYIVTNTQNGSNVNPVYGYTHLVPWDTRWPATTPDDLVNGPLVTTSTKIPPRTTAVVLVAAWNLATPFNIDIPNNTIILTDAVFTQFGANQGSSPNGKLSNGPDMVKLYDGDPLNGANLIDSISWTGSNGNAFSLARDDDAIWKWHISAAAATAGGHSRDNDGSLLANQTMGAQNYIDTTGPCNYVIDFTIPDTVCVGQTVNYTNLSVGGASYIWHFGTGDTSSATNTTYSYPAIGNYSAQLNLYDACYRDSIAKSIVVIGTTQMSVTGLPAVCNGDSALLDAGNNWAAYSWNTGETTATIYAVNAGTYTVLVTDTNGCQATDSIQVNTSPAIVLNISLNDVLCHGDATGQVIVNASGGQSPFQYSNDGGNNWQTSTTFTGMGMGNYLIVAEDANGCQQDSLITINEPAPLQATTVTTDVTCFGDCTGGAGVNVSGGVPPYQYIWSSNQGNGQGTALLNNLCAGNYAVTITDDNGCAINTSTVVNQPAELLVSTSMVGVTCPEMCDGKTNALATGGTGNYTYQWSYAGSNSQQLMDLCEGNYEVTVTDGSNCTATNHTQVVVVNPNPVAMFFANPEQPNTYNTLVEFFDASYENITQWNWTFFSENSSSVLGTSTEQNPFFTYPEEPGIYPVHLQVASAAGCEVDTLLDITITENASIYVPNAFTPNGDSHNNEFIPITKGISEEGYSLLIFNRWGEHIFKSTALSKGWDGTVNGSIVQEGVYVYKLTYEIETNGKKKEKIGHVSLIK